MFVAESDIDFRNPSILFKYYAFTDYALKSVIEERYWFSAPFSFNDPFDCYFEALEDTLERSVAFTLKQMHRSRGLLVTPVLDTGQAKQFATFLKGRIRELHDKAAVFCLSATPYSVLMWSHYSANHQGFCLAFERTPINELGGESCNPVTYDDALTSFKDREILVGGDKILYEIFHRKASSWAYEYEWRIVYLPRPGSTNVDRLRPISAKLKAVLFGWKAANENIERLATALSGRDVQFVRMEAIPRTLRLSIKEMD